MKIIKITLVTFAVLVVYFTVFDVRYTCIFFKNKLGCYDGNLERRSDWFGVDNSKNYLKKLYDEEFLTQGECHSLGHRVGQRAAVAGVGIVEALDEKNSFCGWAFFHGVGEGTFGAGAGHGKIYIEPALKICKDLGDKNMIEVYNCFHTLGHGFYLIDSDINNAFDRCDLAQDESRKGFCYDGVFMAITFPEEDPRANLMRSDLINGGLTSMCGGLIEAKQKYCYWRFVPIEVFVEEFELPPFEYILETSKKVPDNHRAVFWNGFGRELDSRFASNHEMIGSACGWGEYKYTCVIGAAMHMIFYDKGETDRAEDLCNSVLDEDERSRCVNDIKTKTYPNFTL